MSAERNTMEDRFNNPKLFNVRPFELSEYDQKWGRNRVDKRDIFSFDGTTVPVIPVMSEGRAYGAISQEAARRGVIIPQLLEGSVLVENVPNEEVHKATGFGKVMYACIWTDDNVVRPVNAYWLTRRILMAAKLDKIRDIAIPKLGGRKQGDLHWGAMERAVHDFENELDALGYHSDVNVRFVER